MRLKLGTPVTITQYYEPISTSNKYWSDDLRSHGEEIEPDVFRMIRYSPYPTGITGIITGYKRLTIKTVYKIRKYKDWERETGAEIMRETCDYVSSEKENVYVVQTSLTKKYFVKKEWMVGT
jgi:hypothetical protein